MELYVAEDVGALYNHLKEELFLSETLHLEAIQIKHIKTRIN